MNKVKIVAIAKDEAAYFSEWVHHHLFMEVDAIDVYINRTTDNSIEVLNKISHVYPQVAVKSADWIDLCVAPVRSAMQYITYAKAFAEEKERGEFSHLLFIDIDEFWIPTDFSKKITDCIQEVGCDNPIAFEWLNESPTIDPFSPIANKLTGTPSNLVKTLVPLSSELQSIDIHLPIFASGNKPVLLADGSKCERKTGMNQAIKEVSEDMKAYFILHRSIRSHFEYVSLLLKGNPEDDYPFKLNRTGIKITTDDEVTVSLDKSLLNDYQASYVAFVASCDMTSALVRARSFVEDRYNNALIALKENINTQYDSLRSIFFGVALDDVRAIFKAYRTRIVTTKRANLKQLRYFYHETAFYDKKEAFHYLWLAYKIHPEGPWIKNEYYKVKNELNDD